MSITLKFVIERCVDCPYSEEHQILTPDSFEHDVGVFCSMVDENEEERLATYDGTINKKFIFSYEWPSEMNHEIPDWCPYR